jgi:tripartite-type tricarboxylate transporter receptor subunit TctC
VKFSHRRQFVHLAAGAAALPAVSRVARAQTYPTKPVRLVVGFAAGGGNDLIARIVGQKLSEYIAQPVVVENRTGAGGRLAVDYLRACRRTATASSSAASGNWRWSAGHQPASSLSTRPEVVEARKA